jgi:hypothetical protein
MNCIPGRSFPVENTRTGDVQIESWTTLQDTPRTFNGSDVEATSPGGLAPPRNFLCRGLGSRWFTERFHRNGLVTHFQHGQVFCASRRLKNYTVARCRFHQRAP